MKDPNAWKRGMERLDPGFYKDAKGAIHIDTGEFLAAHGYAYSIENEDLLYRSLLQILKDEKVAEVDEREKM